MNSLSKAFQKPPLFYCTLGLLLMFVWGCQDQKVDQTLILGEFYQINRALGPHLEKLKQANQESLIKLKRAKVSDSVQVAILEKWVNEGFKLISLLDQVKAFLSNDLGKGVNPQNQLLTEPDNREGVRKYFILEERGYEMAFKINAYADSLNRTYGSLERKQFVRPAESRGDFIEESFEKMPVIGAITLLTDLQLSIAMYQERIIQKLAFSSNPRYQMYHQPYLHLSSAKDTINLGEKYQASLYIDYLDSTSEIQIRLNGDSLQVQKGKAEYLFETSEDSLFSIIGFLQDQSSNTDTNYFFKRTYPLTRTGPDQ